MLERDSPAGSNGVCIAATLKLLKTCISFRDSNDDRCRGEVRQRRSDDKTRANRQRVEAVRSSAALFKSHRRTDTCR